ncbi:hypothetical protein Aph01nite_48870 [Acrocarpospora phusangensis]|uniref:DUF6603 domain-containing protein n=1 Tax=Acrocarpospora phusangensis TaxID=1070424 RepID=A0A919QI10_9ACTN|nr:DUF6603 domain-containing protein [Acrocarpospora phusangensis]GIH26577.1 hypothetical protein Aph01nite_48870 [Acrocarpospora phusangensis]
MSEPTVARLAGEVGAAVESLAPVLADQEALDRFARDELGIDAPLAFAGLGLDPGVIGAVSSALDALAEALDEDEPDPSRVLLSAGALVAVVAVAIGNVVTAARQAAEGQDPGFADATRLAETLPRRLLDWLVVEQLEERVPAVVDALRVLGVVEVEPVPPDPPSFTTEHIRRAIHPRVLVTLVTDPERWWREAYGWGGEEPRLEVLLRRLFDLGVSLGLPVELAGEDLGRLERFASAVPDLDEVDPPLALRLPLVDLRDGDDGLEIGVALTHLPADPGDPAVQEGLALVPYAAGSAGVEVPLGESGDWVVSFAASLDASGGIGLVARPGRGIEALADLDGTGASAAGRIRVAFGRVESADELALLRFGDGAGVFVTAVGVAASAEFEAGAPPELRVEFAVKQAVLRVAVGESDGFLRSAVPDLRLVVDAGFGFSSRRGAYFVGGAGLEVTVPLGLELGPVAVERVTVRVAARTDGLVADAGAAVSLRLGPFTAVVDGMGVQVRMLEAAAGNLGPVDAEVGFRPPNGIGLAIETPAVSGGGFLALDPEAGRYAGVFELTIVETVSVKVIGLVTTKLPDGSPGFALLLVITADGFTPVQLGMGFVLTGIGGLIALNRTIDVEAVRAGLSSGVLDSVLFAKDPVANAGRIIQTLDRIFPLAPDRLLIGPLAEIGWGSPPVVKIRLALLLEIPQPVRAVLLAALALTLPDPDQPVVELHVDAIGVLDLGRGELALDASLHHSRLWKFTLTGDLALRLNWGSDPTFLMSVGGFHPRFTPPAGLRALERLTFSLSGGDNPRIRFETYLAITSNTIQLGAKVSVRAEAGGFGVDGGGAFDALVQWAPFGLDVLFEAWIKIFTPAGTLCSARLALEVTGPQPWHVVGTVRFSVLWFTVEAGVDFTVGDPLEPVAQAAVDLLDLLWKELSRPASWSAALPAHVSPGVTLAASGTPSEEVVHPLAEVTVRQKVAPLGTTVTRVGVHRPLAGPRSYDLDLDLGGGAGLTAVPLHEQFARAQFTEMSEDEKLTAPSFALLPAGVAFRPDAARALPVDRVAATDLVFETLDLVDLSAEISEPPPGVGGADLLRAERDALSALSGGLAGLAVVPS